MAQFFSKAPDSRAGACIFDEEDVVLGMPGPWAEDNQESSDHYTTKVGGLPDWPMPSEVIAEDYLKCNVCGGDLGLVAQVYAPLTINGRKIDQRVLYIFGCPSAACGISPLSWRTLRVQSCNDTASSSSRADSTDQSEGESSSTREEQQKQATDWWEDDSSWGPAAQVNAGDDVGSLGMQELEAALLEAGYAASVRTQTESSSQQEITVLHEDASSSGEPNSPDLPVLPCFYIYSQNESHPCRGSRAVSALQTSERLEENGVAVNTTEDGQDEAWEGEEYEHDQALSADRTYLKFKKRLDCYPEQCFRYCFGGRPLWANKDRGDPGICTICGGCRTYELQLMPPLLYYLQQACKDLPSTSYGPNDWEWLTVIIYTCAQSCTRAPSNLQAETQRSGWLVVEEATIVQYET
ncbi:hypothetical protein O6H91_03G028600 [Diphasiastrum complanatum]|uniref:Uncharacterized protein n=2 Tax=Diphasiastrum complanatum TaxID=34168 RepID=A0ACC2E5C1_DIPCM|nr:hypothetical protein O6H91_03G028600 [Diphasiastrum complanatum]KAJ7561438.1 hypothetical protein O6H91_03G028600 [Diphasiastrum complanatum]